MRSFAGTFLFGVASFCFTAFVYANTYEVVFNKDAPIVSSVVRTDIQAPINGVISDFALKQGLSQSSFSSNLTTLKSLEFPAARTRLPLEEFRRIEGYWYMRPGFGSYVNLNKDLNNNTVDYLIYARESWQTFVDGGKLETGMEASLFHDNNSRLDFTIESKSLFNKAELPTIGKVEERQLVLLIEDTASQQYFSYSLVQKR